MAEPSSALTNPAPSGKQIKLQLTTKQANFALPDNTGPILIDTNLRRYALSVLVNHLLGHVQQATRIPFDFLINGTILRTSIEEYLTAHGISAETVLHVEYVPAFVPPKYAASFKHDKWVSSIDVLPSAQAKYGQPLILSGSYDGIARIWNTSSQMLAESPYLGETEPKSFIKAVNFVSSTQLVTGGFDRDPVIRLLSFSETEPVSAGVNTSNNISITHEADLHHHKAMVLAFDADTVNGTLLSSSADSTVALWNTDLSTAPAYTPEATPSTKRQKKTSTVKHIKPTSTFHGHKQRVNGVLFSPHTSDQAYSISDDRTLKTWSLETTSILDNRLLPDPLYSLTNITNMYLLAVGSSKGDITLIDPRTSTAKIQVRTIRQAHSSGFACLANDPASQSRFVSGGYDGMLKIWDIRSLGSAAMTIDRKENSKGGKVFAVRWLPEVGILSAGEDGVRIDR